MSFSASVLVCTFGSAEWEARGREALKSAEGQGAREAFALHHDDGTLAGVRNAAAWAATGDALVYLDADDALGDGYLDAMRAAHEARDDRETWTRRLLVPSVQYVQNGECIGEPAIPNRGRWPELSECVIGTLIPRNLFLEVGGFREALDDGTPLTSCEDYDAFLRLYDAGARLVYVPDAVYCAAAGARRNANQSPARAILAESVARRAGQKFTPA